MYKRPMPLSDYKILTVIHKLPWWVLAALASLSVIDYFVTPLQFMDNPIAQGVGTLAIVLLLFKSVDSGAKKLREWWKNRAPPFENLTGQQQKYLIGVFISGSSRVEVHTDTSCQQWFRKLNENKITNS